MSDAGPQQFADLDDRHRDIFRRLVETYLADGEPVGSRTLSQFKDLGLSPASIRNVMADLTDMGILYAPHVSAGRVPTEQGLRLFVDGLMQVGDLDPEERRAIESRLAAPDKTVEDALSDVSEKLSGLTNMASLVVTPKQDAAVKHIEFVSTGPGQGLVVIVFENGEVENRVISLPAGLPPSALQEASNYLNARLRGATLGEAGARIAVEMATDRAQLDELTAKLVEAGVADWGGKGAGASPSLIVRGRSNLLEEGAEDIERVRMLFDDLERKQEVIDLLEAAKDGEGVRIFIGSENRLFSLSGSSVIAAPYRDGSRKIVGVVGVVGPTRLNYAKVIPMVDYTADVIGRLLK